VVDHEETAASPCSKLESLIAEHRLDTTGMEWALHNFGDLYTGQGKPGEAEVMYEQALQGKEVALGRNDISTLDTVKQPGPRLQGTRQTGEYRSNVHEGTARV
jgi:hypothetical protein